MNNETISKIVGIIRDKRNKNMQYRLIAEHLNNLGIKTSQGLEWKGQRVYLFYQRHGKKKISVGSTVPKSQTGIVSKQTIKAILQDDTLSSSQIIRILSAYVAA